MLSKMKKKKLCHGNLKPTNIGVYNEHYPVVMNLELKPTYDPCYAAPEVLLEGKKTIASDVYSIGCLAYYLSTKHAPYYDV